MEKDPLAIWAIYGGLVGLILSIIRLVYYEKVEKKFSNHGSNEDTMPEWLMRLRIWAAIFAAIVVIIIGFIKS